MPNSYRNSDKEGWRILEPDLINLNRVIPIKETEPQDNKLKLETDEIELINLAYQAVTLTFPTEEILYILSVVGIKRILEILLIMQQLDAKVKNLDGFIRKAIRENWSPTSIPIKLPRKQSKRIYELTHQDYEQRIAKVENQSSGKIPFYNWLKNQ